MSVIIETAEDLVNLSPQEIIAARASDALETLVSDLLEKNRTCGLTAKEKERWEQYEQLENVVRMAKANAFLALHQAEVQK